MTLDSSDLEMDLFGLTQDIWKEKKAVQCDGKVLTVVCVGIACLYACMRIYEYVCTHACMYSHNLHKQINTEPHSKSQGRMTKAVEHVKSEDAAACGFAILYSFVSVKYKSQLLCMRYRVSTIMPRLESSIVYLECSFDPFLLICTILFLRV